MDQKFVELAERYDADLAAAIKQLYQVFYSYTPTEDISKAMMENQPEFTLQELKSKPIKEFGRERLEKFSFSCLTTMGTLHDFKMFLPRLLELIAYEEPSTLDSELVVSKIPYAASDACAGPRAWKSDERDAIDQFLTAWWLRTITQNPLPDPVPDYQFEGGEEVVAAIIASERDIDLFLAAWSDCQHPHARLRLATVVAWGFDLARRKRSIIDHQYRSHEAKGNNDKFMSWITHPERRKEMEQAYFNLLDEPWSAYLSNCVTQLESLARIWKVEDKS